MLLYATEGENKCKSNDYKMYFILSFQNGRLKHKRIRTKLSESLYTTEDTIKFVFKVHSCSGTIRSFCRFKSIEIEVFNRTYDCCSGKGYAIAIVFNCIN